MSTISFATKQVHLNLVLMHQNLKQTDVHCLTYLLCDMNFIFLLLLGIVYFRWHHIYAAILLIISSVCILIVITFETWCLILFAFILTQLHCLWHSLCLCVCVHCACFVQPIPMCDFFLMLRSYEWKDFSFYHFIFCSECVACVYAFCKHFTCSLTHFDSLLKSDPLYIHKHTWNRLYQYLSPCCHWTA